MGCPCQSCPIGQEALAVIDMAGRVLSAIPGTLDNERRDLRGEIAVLMNRLCIAMAKQDETQEKR